MFAITRCASIETICTTRGSERYGVWRSHAEDRHRRDEQKLCRAVRDLRSNIEKRSLSTVRSNIDGLFRNVTSLLANDDRLTRTLTSDEDMISKVRIDVDRLSRNVTSLLANDEKLFNTIRQLAKRIEKLAEDVRNVANMYALKNKMENTREDEQKRLRELLDVLGRDRFTPP